MASPNKTEVRKTLQLPSPDPNPTTTEQKTPKADGTGTKPKTPMRETIGAKLEKTFTMEMLKTIEMFQRMGISPKADSPEDLKRWMRNYLQSQGELEEKTVSKSSTSSSRVPSSHKDTVTKMTMSHPPKVTWFSGTEQKAGDTTYALWRHEVQCLLKQNYDEDAVLNAVRRSLRGEAGHVAMRLDLDATVHDIILKLDSIYGSVDKREELLAEFYGSRQKEDESVTSWSCRLEGILGKAVDRGLIQRKDIDGMLHAMLWTGLKPSLKDISGHKYDTIKDFDGLRVSLRQIENDHITRNASVVKPHSAKAVTTQPEDSNLQELKGMIKQINTRLDSYESRWNQHRGRGKGRGRGQYNKGKNESTQKDYQCWRCGQMGHLKIGCKVRMDHSRQNLNSNKPMPGERS